METSGFSFLSSVAEILSKHFVLSLLLGGARGLALLQAALAAKQRHPFRGKGSGGWFKFFKKYLTTSK